MISLLLVALLSRIYGSSTKESIGDVKEGCKLGICVGFDVGFDDGATETVGLTVGLKANTISIFDGCIEGA